MPQGRTPEQKIYTNRFRGWARSTPIAHASAISTGRPTSNKPFTPQRRQVLAPQHQQTELGHEPAKYRQWPVQQ
ncbi:hypothetical protein PPS11_41625 [Pseudomonas putida S11]|nr:hypothetical protein PPS11_41625 [Pseudomonas putida S11]